MIVPITAVQTQPSARVYNVQHYTNTMQDVERVEKSCANIDAI